MKTAPPYGYEEWYQIRSHEIDYRKFITIPSLLMLMQEASMQNAIDLKVSIWDLEEKQISWVLLRKQMVIKRLPSLGEKIKVITYPAGFDRVLAYRDFWVYDAQEELVGHAGSTWTLLNLESRRLQRIPPEMLEMDLPSVTERLPLPDSKIVLPEKYSNTYEYCIRHFDLDWNHHVNNVVLSKLMLQSVPEDHYESGTLDKFTFHIKSECHLGEQVKVEYESNSHGLFHHRIIGHDGRVVAVAESIWTIEK